MSSILKRFRRKKPQANEFEITTSVSSLTIECVKEKWNPNSLSIVWDKENPKHSSTKSVPWQSGIKNPYRGIHVWPQPDPVKTKLALIKNAKNELQCYQDRTWTFLVQDVSPSGHCKVIATGGIDIADYISSEEPASYDITVTLKPKTKNVVSGSMEFSLSSVMLEDGLPRRTDKEIFDEFMKEAKEYKKNSLQNSEECSGKESDNKGPVPNTSTEEKKYGKSQFDANNDKLNAPKEAAACNNNNNSRLPVKSHGMSPVTRPSRPSPPPQKVQASDDLKNFDLKEQKSEESCSSKCVLGQEPGKQEKVKSAPGRRKCNWGIKKKLLSIPRSLTRFGRERNNGQGSLSSESKSHPGKKTPEKDCDVIGGQHKSKGLDGDEQGLTASVQAKGEELAVKEKGDDTSLADGTSTRGEASPVPFVVAPSLDKQKTTTFNSQQISLYAREQISLLKEEIACLKKGCVKLESEMQIAINTKGCEEELRGLAQGWLALIKHKDDVTRRKQDLEVLEKQMDFEECCNILRNELKLLLEVEGWRKTAEHIANEQRLLNILVSFAQFKCPTGLKL